MHGGINLNRWKWHAGPVVPKEDMDFDGLTYRRNSFALNP
jgi:hypothetical protein